MAGHISTFDKSVRVWFGLAMVILAIQSGSLLPWSVIGGFMLLTVVAGFCPLYAVAGFSTPVKRMCYHTN